MKALIIICTILMFVVAAWALDCEEMASGNAYADPEDCRAYFVCADPSSTPVRNVCPSGTHFYIGRQMCIEPEECDL